MKTRIKKKFISLMAVLLALASVFTGVFSVTTEAANVYGTIQTNDGDGDGESVVVPFRSYYVPYISKNASEASKMIQYVWCKLFTEELNYGPGQTYYTASYGSKWSDKYYGDYVTQYGEIKSSKGTQVTYNDDFDGFLYQTIMANPDFIINFINVNTNQGNVFHNYAMKAKDHTDLADALIDITADGKYLGGGKTASNNTFLKGSGSSGALYGSIPNWYEVYSRSDTHDIDVLRLFGARYSELNALQKQWVRTYMSWLVSDYVTNSYNNSAVASYSNSPSLYELIATSYDGFVSDKAQEFFNHCIGTNSVNVGDLIYNTAMAYGMNNAAWYPTGEADIRANTNMSVIFTGDADCDYGTGYGQAVGRGSGSGDGDYDWLAYNIAYNTSNELFNRLRALVNGYSVTKAQLDDWMLRYKINNPQPGPDPIGDWILHAGETETKSVASAETGSCNKGVPLHSDGSEYAPNEWGYRCGGHDADPVYEGTKSAGVRYVKYKIQTSGSGVVRGNITYSMTITDLSTGAVLYNRAGMTSEPEYTFDNSQTASNTIKIRVSAHVHRKGASEGSSATLNETCTGSMKAEIIAEQTYADMSNCMKGNHTYDYHYAFFDVNGKPLTNGTTIPYSCTATASCSCGHVVVYNSTSVVKTSESSTNYEYRAYFPGGLEPKTIIVSKTNSAGASKTYSPTQNRSLLVKSGFDGDTFEATRTTSHTEHGGTSTDISADVSGTVTLPSSSVNLLGAKSVTITATAGETTYKLKSPKYGDLPNSSITLSGSNTTATTHTWDLRNYSDKQLEGAYIVATLHTHNEMHGGTAIGQTSSVTAHIAFGSIKVQY